MSTKAIIRFLVWYIVLTVFRTVVAWMFKSDHSHQDVQYFDLVNTIMAAFFALSRQIEEVYKKSLVEINVLPMDKKARKSKKLDI